MKSILLITPENPEIHRFRKWQLNNFTQITMPYLAGFIDERRYRIRLVDEYNQRIPYDWPADLAAITVNTPNAPHCYQMAARFRAQGVRVVMGGPHATLRPDEAAAHCDHLVVGEAEETWPLFLDEFDRGVARPRYVGQRAPSLRGLPIPRRDLIGRRRFTKGAVFATRGCPYACRYCNLKQIYWPEFRTRPVDEVIADIRSMTNRYFVFWDDNFFADREYSLELLRALQGVGKRWAAQVTIDRCADEELLRLAREAGCMYLFVGLETFTGEGLASVDKRCNEVDRYASTIRTIHRHGISAQAGIVFGLDSDAKDVFASTLRECEALGIDGATVSLLTPLPGTELHAQMEREGRLRSDDWAWYNGKTRVAFTPKQMTADELYAGYMWFRKRFYSLRSTLRRMAVSRTHAAHVLPMNLGYRLAIRSK